jgi:hypothetical protein
LIGSAVDHVVTRGGQIRWYTFLARDVTGRAELGLNQIRGHGVSYHFRFTAGYSFTDTMDGSAQYALQGSDAAFSGGGYVANTVILRLRKSF